MLICWWLPVIARVALASHGGSNHCASLFYYRDCYAGYKVFRGGSCVKNEAAALRKFKGVLLLRFGRGDHM